jgi:hypothetical protein
MNRNIVVLTTIHCVQGAENRDRVTIFSADQAHLRSVEEFGLEI